MPRKVESREQHPRIPGRRVSEEEANVQYKYGSLRILRDGRVRFSARTVPGLPELGFSAHHGAGLADGTNIWSLANYSITAGWPGECNVFMLFLSRHRVVSACFNFGLSPDNLRKAVALLRRAGGGLERWIIPGLEFTQSSLARGGGRDPETLKVIPELLESVRELPVAGEWKRQRRAQERNPA